MTMKVGMEFLVIAWGEVCDKGGVEVCVDLDICHIEGSAGDFPA